MKKILFAFLALALLLALVSCGGPEGTESTGDVTDVKDDGSAELEGIDLLSGGYKVVYDVSDSNAITFMTNMISAIAETSGTKLSSLNSGNPETEYEIQFGLKTGREEAESLYNEIAAYTDSETASYSIRTVGKKIVIAASDKQALKVAAERFAEIVSYSEVFSAEYDETAIFDIASYQRGVLKPVYADEFMSSAETVGITVDGKPIGLIDGKRDYFRATEGKTSLPEITVKTKYPSAKIEINEYDHRYEIKIKSADGTEEEIYNMSFIETAPLDKYSLDTWLIPYWEGNITYHESIMFVGDEGAPLLYTPEHILSVRSSDLQTEYVEGVDYEVKDGKIYRLEGSAMPHFTKDEFYPKSAETSVSGKVYEGLSKPFVLFSEGSFFHEHQVFVTYAHNNNGELYVPQTSTKLHKFIEKLERGEEVTLLFYGDSITAGANASGNSGVLPGTPMWTKMVTSALQAKYPQAKIKYVNTAVGGKATNWAVQELEARVNAYKPDLVIVGFGMNDGGRTVETFIANKKKIADGILAANPDCEIAMIATMLPHKETKYWGPQRRWEGGLVDFVKDYDCIDVVPVTSVHNSLLTIKRYYDMTGNNVNHPNDFLIRIYAQTILKVLGAI